MFTAIPRPVVRSSPCPVSTAVALLWLLVGAGGVCAGEAVAPTDGYRCRGRWIPLLQADGEWLVATQAVARLVGGHEAAAVLSGHPALADRALVCRRPSASGARLGAARSPAGELQALRVRFGSTAVNPVWIHPRTGLRQFTRSQIIIRLAPGARPDDLPAPVLSARPVCGTLDQFVLRLAPLAAEDELALVSRLAGLPQVLWAEPDFLKEWRCSYLPADPLFPYQWHLRNLGYVTVSGNPYSPADVDIDATEAWDRGLGSSNVVVAVMDDGVQSDHPDLVDNLAFNAGEVPGNDSDDDANGYVDDILGWDFASGNNNADPKLTADNHGTMVAGLVAARAGNGVGGCGAAPGCRLLPVKLFLGSSYAGDSAVADAIRYAAGLTSPHPWRGADVINMSFGTGAPSEAIDSALHAAATLGRGGRGCVVVVAGGNSAGGSPAAPAYRTYTKPLDPGTYTFEWQYSKNGSVSAGEDCCRLGQVILPNGVIERFDAATAPVGWNLTPTNDPGWQVEDNPARAFSTGRYQLRSNAIGSNATATVRSPAVTFAQAASVQFRYWVSTETNADVLSFRAVRAGVTTPDYEYVYSGVPMIDPAVAYPASHSDVIAVGATAEFGYRSCYSPYGDDLDLVAPGGGGLINLTTTDRTGSHGVDASDYTSAFGGTSASTPLTAGAVALLLSRRPELTAAEVHTLLRMTADKVGRVAYSGGETNCGGFNPYYGYGRINAGRLLWLARAGFTAAAGGAITPPGGVTPLFCATGTVVSLAATPAPYHAFAGWVVTAPAGAVVAQPAATNTTATILDDVTVAGTFAPLLTARGTPHYWLASFGLGTPSFDAGELTDGDRDGHVAWQEWLTGTNPLDGQSVLRVRELRHLPEGRCVLTWPSVAGHAYAVMSYTAPAGGGTPLVGDLAATPPLNVCTTPPLPAATLFLRVQTAPP